MTRREFGLEDPELQIRNRPRVPSHKEGLDFQRRECLSRREVEQSETSRIRPQENGNRSFAQLRITIADFRLSFWILNFEQ